MQKISVPMEKGKTMTDKSTIAELLRDVETKGFWRYSNGDDGHEMTAEDIADYLTENGVTIQRWIPVTERLPNEAERVAVLINGSIKRVGRILSREWYVQGLRKATKGITHWMPLPETPTEDV